MLRENSWRRGLVPGPGRRVSYFLSRRSPWIQRLHQRVPWFLRDTAMSGDVACGREYVADQPYPPLQPQPPTRPGRQTPSWPTIIGVVLLGVLATVLVVVLLTSDGGEPEGSGEPSPSTSSPAVSVGASPASSS